MAFTVLACCKSHCSFYFLEPCWRVCGSGRRGLVFVFQATITAFCAPAWRKNQSNSLPRQKSPVLSAENPDMNWPCQIPARKKKFNIFIQSRRSWVPFPATLSLNKGDWSTESPLSSWVSPPFRIPLLKAQLTTWYTITCPQRSLSFRVHTHFLTSFIPRPLPMQSDFSHGSASSQSHVLATMCYKGIPNCRYTHPL